MVEPLSARVAMLGAGACSCGVKTPLVHFHEPTCLYRRISEIADEVEVLEDRIGNAASCDPDRVPERKENVFDLCDGDWWYPENTTDEGHCHQSPDEVIEYMLDENIEWDCVIAIDRALVLPTVYAAVHRYDEAAQKERGDDEPWTFTLHATREEAELTVRAVLSNGEHP